MHHCFWIPTGRRLGSPPMGDRVMYSVRLTSTSDHLTLRMCLVGVWRCQCIPSVIGFYSCILINISMIRSHIVRRENGSKPPSINAELLLLFRGKKNKLLRYINKKNCIHCYSLAFCQRPTNSMSCCNHHLRLQVHTIASSTTPSPHPTSFPSSPYSTVPLTEEKKTPFHLFQ